MKIIVVDSNKQFRLIPDSALLLKHRPFFRPDYVQALYAKTALVVKINRLGKYIQEKFTSTYYDEIGFAIHFYDKIGLDLQIEKGFPWERATCFDGSFALSEFMKISEISECCAVETGHAPFHAGADVLVRANSANNFSPLQASPQTFSITPVLHQIPTIISELSTHMTLKIGDYIAIELGEINSAPFEINDVLRLSLDEKEVVRVVVK